MKKTLLFASVGMFAFATAASAQISINEIRIDNTGTDTDEYFELAGQAGASLDGYTYLVIGDGTGGSGVIENVTDLTGQSIQADGLLAVHDSDNASIPGGTCGGYDLVDFGLSFENSDNVTHLLVFGFVGANGDDLDTNDDGTLDSQPWSQLIDSVALIETVGTGDLVYSNNQVGPDGTFVPGHVYFCAGTGWVIGPFSNCAEDTPGSANINCPVSVEDSSWGVIKNEYR